MAQPGVLNEGIGRLDTLAAKSDLESGKSSELSFPGTRPDEWIWVQNLGRWLYVSGLFGGSGGWLYIQSNLLRRRVTMQSETNRPRIVVHAPDSGTALTE